MAAGQARSPDRCAWPVTRGARRLPWLPGRVPGVDGGAAVLSDDGQGPAHRAGLRLHRLVRRAASSPSEVTRAYCWALPPARLPVPAQDGRGAAVVPDAGQAADLGAHVLPVDGAPASLALQPGVELDLPGQQQRLPRHILSGGRGRAGAQCLRHRGRNWVGAWRDRAMLEALYSTGTPQERAGQSAHRRRGPRARHGAGSPGQGQEGRVVPSGIGPAGGSRSTSEVRPDYLEGEDEGTLFLAKHGEGCRPSSFRHRQEGHSGASLERFKDTHPNAASSPVAMRAPRTCWRTGRTSATSRRCWGTRT